VRLPEAIFDMDGPGHYFRRIKNVALSIPCVTGPYASVNCTLTLLKSSIRVSPLLDGGDYARADADDSRFSDNFSSMQSIVTSSAQNDSGLFETNLRDERYLPFENSGAESEWQLQLPADPSDGDPRQFDYDSIADVILHLRYTAREGGAMLRNGAMANLKDRIAEARMAGSVRLLTVRNEFATEWARFKSGNELMLDLRKEHFPMWMQGALSEQDRFDVEVIVNRGDANLEANTKALTADSHLGGLRRVGLKGLTSPPEKPDEVFFRLVVRFNNAESVEDLWLAITWSGDE
jgi:hypothetical protein